MTPNQKKSIKIKLQDYKKRIEVLSKHNLFEQLNGNPNSISTLASFYNNDFVDSKLVDIYKLLIEDSIYSNSESTDTMTNLNLNG